MPEEKMTFEEVDRIVREYQARDKERAVDFQSLSSEGWSRELCEVFVAVRPILEWIVRILPKHWAEPVERAIMIVGHLCQLEGAQ